MTTPLSPFNAQSRQKWLAIGLGIVAGPLTFLYVAQPVLAGVYLAGTVLLGYGAIYLHLLPNWLTALLPLLMHLVCAVHAMRLAGKWTYGMTRPWYSRWYGLLLGVVGLSLVGILIRAFVMEPFRIPSSSNSPTLNPGDQVLAQKWGYGHYDAFGITLLERPISAPMTRGDIVMFDLPRERRTKYIFRLIGLPGDTVEYKQKKLKVNGVAWEQQNLPDVLTETAMTFSQQRMETAGKLTHRILLSPDRLGIDMRMLDQGLSSHCKVQEDGIACTIPAGHYFVMGDNRDNAADSRYIGLIPANHILGKMLGNRD